MSSLISSLTGGSHSNDRMLRNFSLNEFALLAGSYKHMFKDQLRQPTADNNHIVNYNLKMQNYVIVNSSIHMISAGMFTFLVKSVLGNIIDRVTLNYLGSRKQLYAMIFIYGAAFYFSFQWLNTRQRLNINHMVNARDFNGEIMMNLILKFYPYKVNQERFRQSMMDKYESQLLKINNFEQMLGLHDQHFKIANPEAVAAYVQQSAPSATQPTPNPPVVMPMAPNPAGLQAIQSQLNPQVQLPQAAQTPNFHQTQDANLQKLLHQQQPDNTPQEKPAAHSQTEQIQVQRDRIIDQMRDHQQKSPYLSTNPILVQPSQQQQQQQQIVASPQSPHVKDLKAAAASQQGIIHSPYFIVQQEISRESGSSNLEPGRIQEQMQSYYMQNIAMPQQQQRPAYQYQGHYYNVAQQAKKDSS